MRVFHLSAAAAVFSALVSAVSPARTAAPHLLDMIPDSGPAGPAYPIRATIHGEGFMPKDNIVEFGPAKIPHLASGDGISLTFGVPKALPSRGEAPPAMLPPGRYPVRVRTSSGLSNRLVFTLTRGR